MKYALTDCESSVNVGGRVIVEIRYVHGVVFTAGSIIELQDWQLMQMLPVIVWPYTVCNSHQWDRNYRNS